MRRIYLWQWTVLQHFCSCSLNLGFFPGFFTCLGVFRDSRWAPWPPASCSSGGWTGGPPGSLRRSMRSQKPPTERAPTSEPRSSAVISEIKIGLKKTKKQGRAVSRGSWELSSNDLHALKLSNRSAVDLHSSTIYKSADSGALRQPRSNNGRVAALGDKPDGGVTN